MECLVNQALSHMGYRAPRWGSLAQGVLISDLVAVYPADPGVQSLEKFLLEIALLLPACIVQVVGMNYTHHVVKFVCPALAVMVPVQVLWLL